MTPPAIAPPKPKAPPPSAPPSAKPKAEVAPRKVHKVTRGPTRKTDRIGIYGPGGVGKTSLARLLGKVGIEPLFIDLARESSGMNVASVDSIDTWSGLMDVLADDKLIEGFGAIIIDNMTVAQELAVPHVLATIPNIKSGKKIWMANLKQYGWGEGDAHLYDTMLRLLAALDRISTKRHVVVIMHECNERVANAAGSDYLCVQPSLIEVKQARIRTKVTGWLEHLFYVDIFKDTGDGDGNDGEVRKAIGGQDEARVIQTSKLPHVWAKHRDTEGRPDLPSQIEFLKNSPLLWEMLFGKAVTTNV